MRQLEFLLLIVLVLAYLTQFQRAPRWRRAALVLSTLAIVLIPLHLLAERYRWQMLPAFAMAVLLFARIVYLFTRLPRGIRESDYRAERMLRLFLFPILLLAILLPFDLPVFCFPEPTGPHEVGVTDLYFVDMSRRERLTPDPDDHREISIQVWYPAAPGANETPRSYLPVEATRAVARFREQPPWLLAYRSLAETHSIPNATPEKTSGPYPLIVFNHDYAHFAGSNVALFEELASDGYVVASVAHAHESAFFLLPQGEVKSFDPENAAYQLRISEANTIIREAATRIEAADDRQQRARLYRDMLKGSPALQQSARIWADDISFAIDRLAELDSDHTFLGEIIDMRRLGVMGYGFGGAAAAQACLRDERCIAGMNMDGWAFGDLIDNEMARPFLFMSADQATSGLSTVTDELFYQRATGPAYFVQVKGFEHDDFSDLPLCSRSLLADLLADVCAERCIEIQRAYVRAFFDRYLKGIETPLLDGPSPDFPEIIIRSRIH